MPPPITTKSNCCMLNLSLVGVRCRSLPPAGQRPNADISDQSEVNRLLAHDKAKHNAIDAKQNRVACHEPEEGRVQRVNKNPDNECRTSTNQNGQEWAH